MKRLFLSLVMLLNSMLVLCQTTSKEKILGKWQSVKDKKQFLTFTKNYYIETYVGAAVDSSKYTIKKDKIGDKLIVFDSDGNFEYYIITLNATDLELSYVGRGNTTLFKRVKPKPSLQKKNTAKA